MSRNGPPGTGGPWDRIRILSPLGERDFRLLWSGLVVSLVGDGIFLVAVAWQAYSLQDSPMALAGVGLAASLSQLALSLVGGAVSDRLSRRTVLLLSDVARGTALVVLGLLVLIGTGIFLAARTLPVYLGLRPNQLTALTTPTSRHHSLLTGARRIPVQWHHLPMITATDRTAGCSWKQSLRCAATRVATHPPLTWRQHPVSRMLLPKTAPNAAR